jgi:beta-lactamase superfamily II metal-dependent hydrolase
LNTNPQADHIGCLPEVLEHSRWGGLPLRRQRQGEAVHAFEEALERENCKVLPSGEGDHRGIPGAKIEILCPNRTIWHIPN